MNTSLVSIIMSTYNHGPYIKASIESVLTQSYQNWELIIVNAGSTDETEKVVSHFLEKDSRIKYINSETKIGIPRAFNLAFEKAKGSSYIARIDSDDAWIDQNKLQKQIEFLERNKEYSAVGGGMIVVDKQGKELYRYLKPETDEDIRGTALITNPIANSTSVVRSEVVERVGGVNEIYHSYEDWDFWLKVGLQGKLYNFPEYFSYYTYTGRNKSMVYLRTHTLWAMKIIKHYRPNYPHYYKGLLVHILQLLYSFNPFFIREKLNLFGSRVKKILAGSRI